MVAKARLASTYPDFRVKGSAEHLAPEERHFQFGADNRNRDRDRDRNRDHYSGGGSFISRDRVVGVMQPRWGWEYLRE